MTQSPELPLELEQLFPHAYPLYLACIEPLTEDWKPMEESELRTVDKFVGLCVREIAHRFEALQAERAKKRNSK